MIVTVHPPSETLSEAARSSRHVLLVVDQFPEALGGGERIALRLAELLPRYGYRTSILTFSIQAGSPIQDSAPCPVYLLPLKKTFGWSGLRGAFALRRFLREQDILLVQTFFESSDLWGGLVVKMLSSAKLIWSRRDMGILRGRKHQLAYRVLSRLPDRVFAVSQEVGRYCMTVDGVPPSKVVVIYNGLDISASSAPVQPRTSRERVLITTAGNIRRIKGHDVFVEAAALLASRFQNCFFSIAGAVLEEGYSHLLKEQVAALGLSNRLFFLGCVPSVPEVLREADVFVLPSRSEGFSNAILEAMVAGLPVIATDVGGNAEAVKDGETGLIVPPEDAGALADAITRLVSDSALAMNMGAAGRRRILEKFTTESMLRQTAEVYASLLTSANHDGTSNGKGSAL